MSKSCQNAKKKKQDQQAKVTINRITYFQNSIKMLYQKTYLPQEKVG